jgi:hypothetical protein
MKGPMVNEPQEREQDLFDKVNILADLLNDASARAAILKSRLFGIHEMKDDGCEKTDIDSLERRINSLITTAEKTARDLDIIRERIG